MTDPCLGGEELGVTIGVVWRTGVTLKGMGLKGENGGRTI